VADRDAARVLASLHTYGKRRLAAHRYPGARHTFTAYSCPHCGLVPLMLRIEHHTGSRKRNFRGMVFARCSVCGWEDRIFSFTGKHRSYLSEEKPACPCGETGFYVGMVEHIEGDDGLPGFFDERVLVGECSRCGRGTAFLFTD